MCEQCTPLKVIHEHTRTGPYGWSLAVQQAWNGVLSNRVSYFYMHALYSFSSSLIILVITFLVTHALHPVHSDSTERLQLYISSKSCRHKMLAWVSCLLFFFRRQQDVRAQNYGLTYWSGPQTGSSFWTQVTGLSNLSFKVLPRSTCTSALSLDSTRNFGWGGGRQLLIVCTMKSVLKK